MHLKYTITLLLFISINHKIHAQPGFHRIYDTTSIGYKFFVRIFVDEEKIFAFGLGYEPGSPQGIELALLDTMGNILKQNFLIDSLNDFYSSDYLWGDVLKTTQGYYAFPAGALNRGADLLIQIDSNLSVKSIFEYVPPDAQTAYDNGIVELHDGGFFISGTIYSAVSYRGFVRRTDKFGNVIWSKFYSNNTGNRQFASLIKVNDNRFVLGGGDQEHGSLWVIDSNGIVLEQKIIQQPNLTSIDGLLPSSTGEGMIGYGFTYQGQGQWGAKFQPSIMKFNEALELEWFHYIGPNSTYLNAILDIEATPDGHYVVAGERTSYGDVTQPSNDWGGWLYKFNEQGDSLWSRADNAPQPYDATGEFVYGGVGVLPSGSIVAGGKGDVGGRFVGFVLKVSPDGCLDSLSCLSTAAPTPEEGVRIRVYPNPTSGVATFAFGASSTGLRQLVLRDVFGRVLQVVALQAQQEFYQLSLQAFPNGLYYWEVRGVGGVQGGALLLQR